MPPRKSFALLFIAACVALLLHAYYYYPFVADDSFISFRYVDRFLEGKGLTWTDGRPVEGYSNLLWVLLLALLKKITGGELWKIALFLSLTCTVITLWLLLKTMARLTDYNRKVLVWSSAFFVLSAPVAIWINGGLEAPLVMVLLAAAIERLLVPGLRPPNVVAAGVLLGLLALTRPDGVLFTGAISLGLVFYYTIDNPATENNRSGWFKNLTTTFYTRFPALLLLNIVVLLFYTGQLLYRLHYYGEWVPNTALVKIGFTKTRLIKGSIYVARMLAVYLPFVIAALFMVKKTNPRYKAILAFFATVIGLPSLYLAMIGGDIFPGYRHVLPLIPPLCGACSVVVLMVLEKWQELARPPVYYSLTVALLALIFIIQFKDRHSEDGKQERWEWNAMAIGQTIGRGFAASQPLMATTAAGALPYYAALPALDMLGLNDYYLPRHPPKTFGTGFLGHELGDVAYYLQQSPDIYFFNGLGAPVPYFDAETALFKDSAFTNNYQRVKLHYQLNYHLPFPVQDSSFSTAIRLDKFCYMYVKTNSNKIGIRSGNGKELIVPGYFLQSKNLPDSAGSAYLDASGAIASPVAPGETLFINNQAMPAARSIATFNGFSGTALTAASDSLRVLAKDHMVEVYNPGTKTVALKELRLTW